ncbi:MAG: c-type cytochrome [Planctomycetes bacterium]|nr:c-type cytochrome [Planctomycetota bacterium]
MTRRSLANFLLFAAVAVALVGCEGCGKDETKTPGPGTPGAGGGGAAGGSGGDPSAPAFSVKLTGRAPLTREDSVIDAGNGAYLFLQSCASCHGFQGNGKGPSAVAFERKPRDLTDPNYMNLRSDEQLLELLGSGGPHMKRSILMPAWGTFFTSYERKDLVALIRSLHPKVGAQLPGAADARLQWAVLAADKAGALGVPLDPEERRLQWWHVYGEKAVGKPPDEAKLIGYEVFPRAALAAGDVTLALGFGKDLKLVTVAAHQKVALMKGDAEDPAQVDAVDKFLAQFVGADAAGLAAQASSYTKIAGLDGDCATLFAAVRKAAARLGPALEQDKADYAALVAFKDPKNLPAPASEGERVYREKKCWECHGFLGNAKSLGVVTTDPDPRDLSDAAYMKGIKDDFIRVLLKKGGRHVNASETMPAYEANVSDAEIEAMLTFTRSLAR